MDESLDEKYELMKSRGYWVVKANRLIQKNRFKLSLPEQKALAYICSLIKPNESELWYEFEIRDYCKICGIDYDNGNNYLSIKSTLKKLRDHSMWLQFEGSDTESTVSWLDRVEINRNSGRVRVRIDDRLAPYLFSLSRHYTRYQLYNVLAMRSAFSIRMYELLKSYTFQKSKEFSVDELKKILMVEGAKSYRNFNLFRTKVIDKALDEINFLTDLKISYETINQGRKVIAVKFYMSEKPIEEQYISMCSALEYIDARVPETADNEKSKKTKTRKLSLEEQKEYDRLVKNSEQIHLNFKN